MGPFQKFIIHKYGSIGKTWLSHLPSLVEEISKRYGLSNLHPLLDLSHNYVLQGWQEQTPVILKIGLDKKELTLEFLGLKAFSNYGAVKVLERFPEGLLLERVTPGTSLKSYFSSQEKESLEIFCSVIQKLHQAPLSDPICFPQVKNVLEILDIENDIPITYLEKARERRDDLLETPQSSFLLHGDLHHDNILKGQETWVVIDPKPVVGEIGYEVARFIQNPLKEIFFMENAEAIIYDRLQYFSHALRLDFSRLRNWCFVNAILGWIWAEEDEKDQKFFKKLATILY